MKKTLGYYLFGMVYNLCRLFPIQNNRVMCIMTHDEGSGSNVSLVVEALKKESKKYIFSYIKKSDTLAVKGFSSFGKLLSFFFIKPYQMARANIILLDNIFLPYAYLHRRKKSKVVQLWHGTGTIKKFGQDVNTGQLRKLEKRANDNITHLIVNSLEMKKLYASAFGVDGARIYPVGLPKTDELQKRLHQEEITGKKMDREYIYRKYDIPQKQKLILYAPTFRDQEIVHPKVVKQLQELLENLPTGYAIGLRLHPFVAQTMEGVRFDRVYQMSFEEDVNTLLMAADLLVTDYSSIIFEYCLTRRPMIFYAYDYEEFSDRGRGFYYRYQSYVPGPVAYTGREVCDCIKENRFDQSQIEKFVKKNYHTLDGPSRIHGNEITNYEPIDLQFPSVNKPEVTKSP
jgi:CDP-ribitol ribitolphosphotransferase